MSLKRTGSRQRTWHVMLPPETYAGDMSALCGARLVAKQDIAVDTPWGTGAYKKLLYGFFSIIESDNLRTFVCGDVLVIERVSVFNHFIYMELSTAQPALDKGFRLMMDAIDSPLPRSTNEVKALLANYFFLHNP